MNYYYKGYKFTIGKEYICSESFSLGFIDNILSVIKVEHENNLFKKNGKYRFNGLQYNKKYDFIEVSFSSNLDKDCVVFRKKRDIYDESYDLLKYFTNRRKDKLKRILSEKN